MPGHSRTHTHTCTGGIDRHQSIIRNVKRRQCARNDDAASADNHTQHANRRNWKKKPQRALSHTRIHTHTVAHCRVAFEMQISVCKANFVRISRAHKSQIKMHTYLLDLSREVAAGRGVAWLGLQAASSPALLVIFCCRCWFTSSVSFSLCFMCVSLVASSSLFYIFFWVFLFLFTQICLRWHEK